MQIDETSRSVSFIFIFSFLTRFFSRNSWICKEKAKDEITDTAIHTMKSESFDQRFAEQTWFIWFYLILSFLRIHIFPKNNRKIKISKLKVWSLSPTPIVKIYSIGIQIRAGYVMPRFSRLKMFFTKKNTKTTASNYGNGISIFKTNEKKKLKATATTQWAKTWGKYCKYEVVLSQNWQFFPCISLLCSILESHYDFFSFVVAEFTRYFS